MGKDCLGIERQQGEDTMEKGRKKKPLPTRRTMIVAFVLTALFAAIDRKSVV